MKVTPILPADSPNTYSAFTLLEMLIVVAILSALAFGAVAIVDESEEHGRFDNNKTRLNKLREAVIGDPSALLNRPPIIQGYVADMGQSFIVGEGDVEQRRICAAVREAVEAALLKVRSGRSLNVIGQAVQAVADREGYLIVQNLGSHGVGRNIHEEPSYVPFDNPEETRVLERGLVLTIEPFFSTQAEWVEEEADGWTLSVPPGNLVAQFEHTLIVTDNGALVVTN